MTIKYNTWYRFDSQEDKEEFLHVIDYIHGLKYTTEEYNAYIASDCLKIVKYADNTYHIRYRTTYDERYMSEVETFKVDKTLYKENKEMKFESLIKLITSKKDEAKAIQKRHVDEQRNNLIINCEAAKLLKPYIDYCISQNLILDETNYKLSILDFSKLNDKEHEKLREIKSKYEIEISEIDCKYDELISLVEAADTFEQAYTLLKAYDVLSKDVKL